MRGRGLADRAESAYHRSLHAAEGIPFFRAGAAGRLRALLARRGQRREAAPHVQTALTARTPLARHEARWAHTAALAAGPRQADQLLGRLLIPVLAAGVIAQVLAAALTYLLPVTVGGGPAGNRRVTATLEHAWRTRAVLGNAGVLALVTLPAGWPQVAAWAAILAGFGTFPVLAVAALAAGHARAIRRDHIREMSPPQAGGRP